MTMDPATTAALLLRDPRTRKAIVIALAVAVLLLTMAGLGITALLFSVTSAPGSSQCAGQAAAGVTQPAATGAAQNTIPSDYLTWFQTVGTQYHVPWVVLAGIAKVESD